ncbi:MAG: hypothetical protein K2I44_00135 [Muribaculaceae bacterium]|nr:hypothetical protein [Muribaculaceae bacterium]
MSIINIFKNAIRLIFVVLALSISAYGKSEPQLPEPELSWKNVMVDNKKTAVFCIFKDSRGLMWLGTNSGLYFYDGVTTHPIGENELFGTQTYSHSVK